jgi:hypothetical protein
MKLLLGLLLLMALPSCGGSDVGRYQWVEKGPGGFGGALDTKTGVFFGVMIQSRGARKAGIGTFRVDPKTKMSLNEALEHIEELNGSGK